MPKGDPARVDKWAARTHEWRRLADQTTDPHVAAVCTQFAEQAETMTRLWRKW